MSKGAALNESVLNESAVVEAGYRNDHDLIERATSSTDPTLRRAAIGALLRSGTLTADRLSSFATDADPRVRRRAAEVAPRIAYPGQTEAFLAAQLDDEPEIAEVACFALGEVGSIEDSGLSTATIDAIENMARLHQDALCREAAVAALGALHTGLATILVACTDKAAVRRRAVIALAPFEGPEVEQALRAALSDRDWQVRQAAEDLMIGSSSVDRTE